MDSNTNPSSKTATADVTSCDMAPVPALLASVASLGERLLQDRGDQEARLELLRAARKLWLSLETPRETVVRHTTVDVSGPLLEEGWRRKSVVEERGY